MRKTSGTLMRLCRHRPADMKLLLATAGHPSIMVTAHTYADLYGSDLDKPGPGKSHGAFEQSEANYEQALTVARGGIEPPTFRFSGGRSYRLSYLAGGQRMPRRAWRP